MCAFGRSSIVVTLSVSVFLLPSFEAVAQNAEGQVTAPRVTVLHNAPLPHTVVSQVRRENVARQPVLTFAKFDTEQGLALSSITCSFTDSKGNIWFGTPGAGISQYDGYNFTTYNAVHGLAHNNIRSITEDRCGNLWFGTAGGLSVYDGRSFKTITTKDGLPDNWVRALYEDRRGRMWVGTNGGVGLIKGAEIENISQRYGLPSMKVVSIFEDSNGKFWIGSSNNGAVSIHGDSVVHYNSKNGLPANAVVGFVEAHRGEILMGTSQGLFRVKNNQIEKVGWFPMKKIRCVATDKMRNIWLGTDEGASYFNGNTVTTFTTEQGLPHNVITSITEDKKGNMWLSTNGAGVCRYDGDAFAIYTTAQGFSSSTVWSVLEDSRGRLWFGTEKGADCFDGERIINFNTEDGLAHNTVYAIKEDKNGNLWFGTPNGVTRYKDNSFTTFTVAQGLASNSVAAIFEDSKGNLWFGSYDGGVSRFDGKAITAFSTAQGLPHNRVLNILEDTSGNIWLSTGNGVSRYDGRRFTNFFPKDGLAHFDNKSLLLDKTGHIWIGTDGGVSRYDGKTFISFTVNNGLPDNVVYDIVEDDNGILWIGTNLGIAGLTFQNKKGSAIPAGMLPVDNNELPHDFIPHWEIFNNKTGVPLKDLNTNAMLFSHQTLSKATPGPKGTIWSGCGDDKIFRFIPAAIRKSSSPPEVVLKSIQINNEQINWYALERSHNLYKDSATIAQQKIRGYGADILKTSVANKFSQVEFDSINRFYPIPQNPVFPHFQNHITFEFGAIETGKSFLVLYQYMLQGKDKNWSASTKKTEATFDNLSPGKYTFKVKARSPEGVWSEPISYSFTVLSPWWATIWMRAIYVVMFIGSVFAIVKLREHSLTTEKAKLEKLVNERTHQIAEQKEIAERQKQLVEQKSLEIIRQNEQLKETHEELQIQRDSVRQKNSELLRLYSFIEEKNFELEKIVLDRTKDLRRAYRDLMKAHQELDTFVYRSSHDFRGPVATILGLCNLVAIETSNGNGKDALYIEKLRDTATKMMVMLNRLIRAHEVKRTTPIHERVDIAAIIHNILQQTDPSLKADSKVSVDASIVINSNPDLLTILLRNLIENALQFKDEKQASAEVLIEATLSLDKVTIRVTNNGCGIPEEIVDRVFDIFYRGSIMSNGAGLGLYEARLVAEKLGGEIRITDHSVNHTSFEVNLPL